MVSVLLTACSFIVVILAGIFIRAAKIVPDNTGDAAKAVLLHLTLPAAVITNFSKIDHMGGEMLLLVLLGILINVVMIIVGVVLTRRKAADVQAIQIMCLPAVNIGAFCIPFIQSFLPALGTVTACIFDVGNSIMCTGGTYAFAAEYVSESRTGIRWREIGRKLVTSPPLMTYVIMFLLAACGIHLPQAVLTLISPIQTANAFVAMLMIGLLFRLDLKKEYLKDIAAILAVRHIFAVAAACFFYFVLPFDLVIRQTLVLVAFGPMSAIAPAYTGMCGGDEGKASAANSLSIVLSIIELTFLLILMGLE